MTSRAWLLIGVVLFIVSVYAFLGCWMTATLNLPQCSSYSLTDASWSCRAPYIWLIAWGTTGIGALLSFSRARHRAQAKRQATNASRSSESSTR